MELRHLRYVVTLAEELHFGRAAERLHMSQPPLSQQIRQLEEELGVKLFHRTKRQVILLEAGIRFVDEARQILAKVESATKVAARAGQGEIGHLAVGTVTAEKRVLIETLRIFGRRYPDVHVELKSMGARAQIDAIREGRIHVGFVVLPVDASALMVETVAHEPLVVALPTRHPLATRRQVPLKALAGEPSILFPRALSPGYYDHVISLCRQTGFSLNIVHESDSIYTALALVAAGLGVSLFPASIQGGKARGIVFREVTPATSVDCAVVYRRELQSSATQLFLNMVKQTAVKFL